MHHQAEQAEQGGQGGEGQGGQCCQGGGARDHDEQAAQMWEQAFFTALRQVRVDILKEKIRKAWGKQMESVADEVMEAMEEEWKAFKQKATAREALKAAVAKGFAAGPR